MTPSLPESELAALRAWLDEGKNSERKAVASGYQGQIHLYEGSDCRLAIKEALGFGPLLWLSRWMLRREHEIYCQLDEYAFAPRCFGLVDNRYLILELIEGEPYRHAEIEDREGYFELMRQAIRELHCRGIAHGDLKRKENLLVIDKSRPCLLDFGTAVIAPRGFAPLRARLYRALVQSDVNAWLKLKSNRQIDSLPEDERKLYRRAAHERIARFVKRGYLGIRWGRSGQPPKRKNTPDLARQKKAEERRDFRNDL
jgi:predicted Ser/Thr protein kinase